MEKTSPFFIAVTAAVVGLLDTWIGAAYGNGVVVGSGMVIVSIANGGLCAAFMCSLWR